MNIQTVAENLRNTIAGKEKYLAGLCNYRGINEGAAMYSEGIRAMLELNINELKRILQDVEQCEPNLPGEGNNYEKWDGDE
jgi:hypothetical protein